jgi:hypothetical protein
LSSVASNKPGSQHVAPRVCPPLSFMTRKTKTHFKPKDEVYIFLGLNKSSMSQDDNNSASVQ